MALMYVKDKWKHRVTARISTNWGGLKQFSTTSKNCQIIGEHVGNLVTLYTRRCFGIALKDLKHGWPVYM